MNSWGGYGFQPCRFRGLGDVGRLQRKLVQLRRDAVEWAYLYETCDVCGGSGTAKSL